MYPAAIAEQDPDKAAVVMAGSGRVITYRELDAESNRLAHLLRARGLRPGDHLAMMLENHPSFLAIAWAAQRSGLYYTPISSRLRPDELAYVVDNCRARAFVCSAAVAGVAAAVTARTPGVEVRLMVDRDRAYPAGESGADAEGAAFQDYGAAIAGLPAEPIADEVEGADMLYSSGTTGLPKGVLPPLPLDEIGTPPPLLALLQGLYGMDGDTVYLSPAPLYHAAPLRYGMGVHRLGGTVVVMEHFDAERALAAIERYRVTHGQFVPTMFIRMLALPTAVRDRYAVSSLRCAVHAAAPCPIEVKRAMIDWWGPVLHEYYAGTEGNGYVCCDSAQWLAHPGTVGRSVLGPLHVCDADGAELPVGEDGAVYFDGGAFEYWQDPDKTAASRDPLGRGWTTLGDIGHLDADGYLYLTDRAAYMIISGGVNIYPQEAENILAVHPAVADVAVFGVPDTEMGQRVQAVVEPAEGVAAGPELAAELIAYCRSRIAHYKCPTAVDFRDTLPRQPTGKLLKRVLIAEYAGGDGR